MLVSRTSASVLSWDEIGGRSFNASSLQLRLLRCRIAADRVTGASLGAPPSLAITITSASPPPPPPPPLPPVDHPLAPPRILPISILAQAGERSGVRWLRFGAHARVEQRGGSLGRWALAVRAVAAAVALNCVTPSGCGRLSDGRATASVAFVGSRPMTGGR